MRFWIPWGLATIVTAIVIYYFVSGLLHGTVSSFNGGLWALMLVVAVGVTGGSLMLRRNGHPGWGALLALVLAIPGVLAGLLLLLVLITRPRWN